MDSAAGSMKSGRKNTLYQAVMPLRGKVLNTINLDSEHMMNNKEFREIFQAIGLGIDEYNITSEAKTYEEKLELIKKHARYGRIIICTDELRPSA